MRVTRDGPEAEAQAPITVLHVDDERGLLELTTEFLQRHHENLTIRTATDPREALEVDLGRMDCIISDYEMPGLDGVEFLKTVREEYPSLPFILFTGKGSEEVASEAISGGVTDYLQKETNTEQYELLCQQIKHAVARQRAQTNYRELFEKTQVGLTIHHPETGRITDTNRAFQELVGYDSEELIGRHPGDLSPDGSPFTREKAIRLIRQTVEKGPQSFQWQDQTKDGEILWLEVTLKQTSINDRQRVLAVVDDITERKEREQDLHRQKERFEAIFEHSNDAILVLNPDEDAIVNANPKAESLLGYSRDELVSTVGVSDIHPDHVEEFQMFIDQVRTEGAGWTDNFCCVTKSGTEREVEISAAPVEHGDKPYLIANIRDITQLREHKQELESVRDRMEFVLRATDAVIWEWDPETDALTTYPEPCPVLGGTIETAANLRGKIHAEDRSQVEDAMESAAQTCESSHVEFRTVTDVEADWVELQIEPVTDQNGSVSLLSGLAQNATERKERERALYHQNERLDEFASVVSHDLRKPLGIADGRLNLAREECGSDHLDDVADALDRMDVLVGDLLKLAREGDRAISPEPVDLAAISEQCWQTVAPPGARLVTDACCTVRADPTQLTHLFENLLQNSIEYGGETVTVTIGGREEGFFIADDGPGIPAEDRERVFDAGYTTSEEGTGFGLRIVKQVIEAHGWDVSVTESANGGARFDITDVDIES